LELSKQNHQSFFEKKKTAIMNFVILALLAALVVAQVYSQSTAITTKYLDGTNAIDFSTTGTVSNTQGIAYVGAFTNLNQTSKISFSATRSSTCTYADSTVSLSVNSVYSGGSDATLIFTGQGGSTSFATNFEPHGLIVSKHFYVHAAYCPYDIVVYSSTH
jgi:hypothetical protein